MKPRSLTFAALALTVALVGCSSDDSSDGASGSAPATDAVSTEAPAAAPATQAPDTAPSTEAPTTTEAATTTVAPTATEAPPEPVRVLVTNDDGVAADGIDAVVQALQSVDDRTFEISVVAPATQQSGSGGSTTDGPLTVTDATTLSGFAATAVEGFPADSVVWALDQGGIDFVPDLVIAGSNSGQNLGPVIDASGTVGAARAAAVRNVPAIAVSAGFDTFDYAASTDALLAYLDEHLDEILSHEPGTPVAEVIAINTPTCAAGVIRGLLEVPLATDLQGFDYGAPVDCTSTVENPADDVQAFFNGFGVISPTPLVPAS